MSEISQEAKEMMEDLMKREVRRLESIYIIYKYDCCEVYQAVLLDRYPMSEKIICICSECKKGTKISIVNPIEFKLLDKIYTKDDLKDCTIDPNHYQYIFIKNYLDEFEIDE